jgi:hypothetical protein
MRRVGWTARARRWLGRAWLGLPLACLLASLNMAGPAGAAPPGAAPPASAPTGADAEPIAVLELDVAGATAEEGAAVTERLREALFGTGRFTLVNRAQLGQILDEQALQQSGCTSAECAVRVGRLLGVRRIVTGRLTRIPPRAWQVSAQEVDVETAETLEMKTQYLEGDLGALLQDGVPRLARALAGESEEAAAEGETGGEGSAHGGPPLQPAAKPVRPAAVVPPVPAEGAVRLAVLPAYVDGTLAGEASERLPQFVARFGTVNEETRRFHITHSFYPLAGASRLGTRAGLEERVWQGAGPRVRPDVAYVQRLGRELGVDAAVLYRIRAERTVGSVQVYVVDMATGRSVLEEGRGAAGSLADVLRDRTRRAVRVYLERYGEASARR